jgi:ATP-dependent helicase/nuclease subunit B
MNEGSVPDRIAGDIFLPDSLRSKLGLRNNESILARDNYIFNATLNWRSSCGRVDIILGKESLEENPLRPSRLLFQCDDSELADRALSLCSRVDSSKTIHPWTSAWKLRPEKIDKDAKIFKEISVTQFRNYLSCPFRFYLKNLMGMDESHRHEMEMDAKQFGTLVHSILEDFGNDEDIRNSRNEEDIYKFLEKRIDSKTRTKFGTKRTVPLLFQIRSMEERRKHIVFEVLYTGLKMVKALKYMLFHLHFLLVI